MSTTKLKAADALAKAVRAFLESSNPQTTREREMRAEIWHYIETYEAAPDEPAKAAPDSLCEKCGIGWILPSGVCDHCNQKAAPDGKPGADWMLSCALSIIGNLGLEGYDTDEIDQIKAIIAKHAAKNL